MSRLAQYQAQVTEGYGYEEFQPIPNGTELVCFIESAAWETLLNRQCTPPVNDEFIKVRYRVAGGDYDNRVIFQKLHILGKAHQDEAKNATTEENALLMLAALDHICLAGALAKLPHDPEDEDLAKLEAKRVLVTVGVNRFTNQFGEPQATNFVRSIAPLPTRTARTADADDAGEPRQRRQRRAR